MFSPIIKLRRIIKAALKVRARQPLAPRGQKERIIRWLMFLAAVILTGLFYPPAELFSPILIPREGEIAREDFIAPTTITVKKSEAELTEERNIALATSPIVLDYDSTVVDSTLTQLDRFITAALDVRDSLARDSLADFGVFAEALSEEFPFVASAAMREAYHAESLRVAHARLEKLLRDDIYFTGVLTSLDVIDLSSSRPVIVRIGGRETILLPERAMDINGALERLLEGLNRIAREEAINVGLHYEIGRHFVLANLRANLPEITKRQNEELARISEIKDQAQPGDLIIRAGEAVTDRDLVLILEYVDQQRRLALQDSFFKANLPMFVRMGLIAIIFGLLYIYLRIFREDIFRSPPKLLAALMIVAVELAGVYLCDSRDLNMYLFPVALAPIMFSILFDTRFGVVSSLFLGLLLGALLQFNFSVTLLSICAGSVGAYSVRTMRARAELFRTMLYLALVSGALALALGYLRAYESAGLTDDLLQAIVGAIAVPILAAGLLPFFESLFGFTTDITLLELSDLNRPLLKRLALEAPGTFHHSIVVGSLAEAASKEIGANSLLARVGAYYHDIGKMDIAEYFIENQVGIKSRHDSITPSMSAIILASHVKRGRQLAEHADLPDQVMNFIEEHHGTMVMSFFYRRALDQGASKDVKPEFCYPGPRPQTKETAIVMLADGVEAASRTLEDPSPARIRSLAQKIIDDRYHSGELKECPLTLADLGGICDAFTQILTGVFHQRVAYPSMKTTVNA